MATIGTLNVALKASTAKFQKGIKRARKAISNFKRSIPGANLLLSKFGAALTIGAFSYFTRNAINAGDEVSKFAARIGVTTEALTGLQYAATSTGVAVSGLRMGMQRMVRRISTAQAKGPMDATAKALEEMGLRASDLIKLSPDQQLRRIADALQGVGTQADKVRLAFALFDSEGVALVNTLAGGSEALDEMAARGKQLGLVFDDLAGQKFQDAAQAMSDVTDVFKGAQLMIAEKLAPWVKHLGNKFVEWATGGGGVRKKIEAFFGFIVGTGAKVAQVLGEIGRAIGSVELAVANIRLAKAYADWGKLAISGNAPGAALMEGQIERMKALRQAARDRAYADPINPDEWMKQYYAFVRDINKGFGPTHTPGGIGEPVAVGGARAGGTIRAPIPGGIDRGGYMLARSMMARAGGETPATEEQASRQIELLSEIAEGVRTYRVSYAE